MKEEIKDLGKAQKALARAVAKANEDWWSPSAKKKVEACRKAVARAQSRLEEVGGQIALALGIEEEHQTPGAFR